MALGPDSLFKKCSSVFDSYMNFENCPPGEIKYASRILYMRATRRKYAQI
jgi:hypothetical protein